MADQPNIKTPTEARQAEPTGHMRWVLLISLLLAIVVLGGGYLWYMR